MLKKNIKYLCKMQKIKIKDLANEIGINHNDLSRNRWWKNIRLSQLMWLANRFNCPLEILVKCDLQNAREKQMYEFIKEEIKGFDNISSLEQSTKKQ